MRIVASIVVSSSMLVAADARADCASGPAYGVSANGSSVKIVLDSSSGRACPDPDGMLRQDESTGEIVKLAQFCAGSDTYVDECVPPGAYRYGLATPYLCTGSCPGSAYFGEVTVTAPLDPSCARAANDPGPVATSTVPPWGLGAEPEQYCPSHGGCFCDSTTATVVSMNGGALAAGAVALALAARRRRKRR